MAPGLLLQSWILQLGCCQWMTLSLIDVRCCLQAGLEVTIATSVEQIAFSTATPAWSLNNKVLRTMCNAGSAYANVLHA